MHICLKSVGIKSKKIRMGKKLIYCYEITSSYHDVILTRNKNISHDREKANRSNRKKFEISNFLQGYMKHQSINWDLCFTTRIMGLFRQKLYTAKPPRPSSFITPIMVDEMSVRTVVWKKPFVFYLKFLFFMYIPFENRRKKVSTMKCSKIFK